MGFHFADYAGSDLARCGEAFSRVLRQLRVKSALDAAELRALSLAWLDETAASGAVSVAGPVLRELGAVPQALDLAHLDLTDGHLLLAVAHEPPGVSERFGYVYLLARAAALAATKSRAKLLVSNWRGETARQLVLECVVELRQQLEDRSPWLWVDGGPDGDAGGFTLLERR